MMAGRNAWRTTSAYVMPTYSAMRKAAAPITGGINCPFTPAAHSIAPDVVGVYPTRFITGIVKVPVVTTLATDDPEIMPVRPDDTTPAFAGPPRNCPNNENAT